jgi:hypothetical protein
MLGLPFCLGGGGCFISTYRLEMVVNARRKQHGVWEKQLQWLSDAMYQH